MMKVALAMSPAPILPPWTDLAAINYHFILLLRCHIVVNSILQYITNSNKARRLLPKKLMGCEFSIDASLILKNFLIKENIYLLVCVGL